MKKQVLFGLLSLGVLSVRAQNVGIGTATPDPSAKLEIADLNRGFLFPRVSLSATNVAAPVTSPANWLVVFNTATAGAGATAVSPGLYYWDGTQWVRLQSGNINNNWLLDGNSNGALRSIGTNDNLDLPLETNNTERMRITNAGNVGIGTSAPSERLHIAGGNALVQGSHMGDETQLRVLGTSGAWNAGISFGSTNTAFTARINMLASSGDMTHTTGGAERMRVTNAGNVGIGIAAPAVRLQVVGGDVYVGNNNSVSATFPQLGPRLFFGGDAGQNSDDMFIQHCSKHDKCNK